MKYRERERVRESLTVCARRLTSPRPSVPPRKQRAFKKCSRVKPSSFVAITILMFARGDVSAVAAPITVMSGMKFARVFRAGGLLLFSLFLFVSFPSVGSLDFHWTRA
jgi:hypothetical protein